MLAANINMHDHCFFGGKFVRLITSQILSLTISPDIDDVRLAPSLGKESLNKGRNCVCYDNHHGAVGK